MAVGSFSGSMGPAPEATFQGSAPGPPGAPSESPARIFTVGHSSHEPQVFLGLLARYGIRDVVDVRSIPSSGRFPHFKKQRLEELLLREGITYRHCPELGNKVDGIAKLLQRPEGELALRQLAESAWRAGAAAEAPGGSPLTAGATAYMCAEALWRDCHRQVIAHQLAERFGIYTFHILPSPSDGVEVHPRDYRLPERYGLCSCIVPASASGDPAEVGEAPDVAEALTSARGSGTVAPGFCGANAPRARRWGKKS